MQPPPPALPALPLAVPPHAAAAPHIARWLGDVASPRQSALPLVSMRSPDGPVGRRRGCGTGRRRVGRRAEAGRRGRVGRVAGRPAGRWGAWMSSRGLKRRMPWRVPSCHAGTCPGTCPRLRRIPSCHMTPRRHPHSVQRSARWPTRDDAQATAVPPARHRTERTPPERAAA
eukprot:scaffold5227_cov105-Isochrysis_galbana.AAC.4